MNMLTQSQPQPQTDATVSPPRARMVALPAAAEVPAAAVSAAAAAVDVSAGLVSTVHCTADGHVGIATGHVVVAHPLAPAWGGCGEADAVPLPPPWPPEACCATGRRYLAAILTAVSQGLSEGLRGELTALLHPDVEAHIGVTTAAPPGRGVAHFLAALGADNQAYDQWRMVPLSVAAPAGGGEVFMWVDESARNVGPLPGLAAASNRTSRSLTIHRLVIDPTGRITQAWTRYQLFDELRRLMLAEGPGEGEKEGSPQEMEVETPLPQVLPQLPTAAPGIAPSRIASVGAAGGSGGGPKDVGAGAAEAEASKGSGGGGSRRFAPDLFALPFVQRLTGRVAAAVASAVGDRHLQHQGEGAAAQAQAAYTVATAPLPTRGPTTAPSPATPLEAATTASTFTTTTPPSPLSKLTLADMQRSGLPPLITPTGPTGAPTVSTPTHMEPETLLSAEAEAGPGAVAVAEAVAGVGMEAGAPETEVERVVADLEAQAGRSVATWLGLVDSSYSGVRDIFGCTSEELALWEALGLWPRLPGARGREQVLEQLQHLHAEYDIRIQRGSWAVDRSGLVAYCAWEAQVRRRAGVSTETALSPAGSTATGGNGADMGPAGASTGSVAGPEGVAMRVRTSEQVAAGAAAQPQLLQQGQQQDQQQGKEREEEGAGVVASLTSMDVYGLSPLGHLTDVVMYRTALPGEAEGVFKREVLAPHPPVTSPPPPAAVPPPQ